MKYKHHIIKNFTKDASIWEKIAANLMFMFSVTKISFREKMLTKKEYHQIKKIIRAGDILLVGSLRRAVRLTTFEPVTHSILYVGHRRGVHAAADGVEYISLKKIFKEYDSLILLRPKINEEGRKKITSSAVKYAKSQIGKPFDFLFENGPDKFYCTHLVYDSFKNADFDTGIKVSPGDILRIIKPIEFEKGNFEKIFLSKWLIEKDGEVVFTGKI